MNEQDESGHLADIQRNFSRLKQWYDEGDARAALYAIKFSWWFRISPPDWALKHVADGIQRWSMADVRTLDEAMGVTRPKGFRLDAENRAAMHAGSIFVEVNKRLEVEAYCDEIFEEVGRPRKLGKTATKELYYAFAASIESRIPKSSREKEKKPAGKRTRRG